MGGYPVSAVYRSGYRLVRSVPRPVASAIGWTAGTAVGELSADRRLLVERNLKRVYGQSYDGLRLRRSVHKTFVSYARYWVDSFRLPGLSPDEIDAGFTVSGFGNIARSIADGIGPILVLPHLGGWEWAGFWLASVLGMKVTVVVEPVEPKELFDFFVDFRRALGMHIVPLGPEAGSEVLRAIKDRHVVCLLADRDILGDGLEVDFFGERTTLPAGPATIALRTGAPLLPAAVYFTPTGNHGVVQSPIAVKREGRFRDDVTSATRTIASHLEGLIRAAPEQWHLQQPNWPSDHEALRSLPTPTDSTCE